MYCMLLSGRWKVDERGTKIHHSVSKLPILQFVAIKRKDCGEWAIPGVCGFYSFSSDFIAKVNCLPPACHRLFVPLCPVLIELHTF